MRKRNLSERGVSAVAPLEASEATADERDPSLALARALEFAGTGPSPSHVRTTRARTITRRGVMWLGQTCNLRCYFCYFLDRIEQKDHPEHAFMDLEKAKTICKTLVDRYKNDAIDIQGGEPTIWKPIFELVTYCHSIGLEPTLITNAIILDDIDNCRKLKAAGIRDLLVSVHGLGEVHDRVVQLPGAHVRQMKALRNMREVDIPFRFNCVLSKPVVSQLPYIAELAVKTGALVVNFLAFNPFEDQAKGGRRSANNVPMYGEIEESLTRALDVLDAAGVEANVRYYPICMAQDRHRKSMYNFQQLPYDHHEWDYASWSWTGMQPQRMKDGDPSGGLPISTQGLVARLRKPAERVRKLPVIGDAAVRVHDELGRLLDAVRDKDALYRQNARKRAESDCGYRYSTQCDRCSVKNICDGFHGDYAALFGTDEAEPIALGLKVDDPLYYVSRQDKVVDG
jgi:MoaA/NifB/PqqE/SkfB family radical SAM enzyme